MIRSVFHFLYVPVRGAMPKTSKLTVMSRPIERGIHLIRGHKVMLDSDLAALYQVATFRLNEAVKRNRPRFPADFMFQLTRKEAASLTSQPAISNKGRGGRRTLPYAFTEHGVAMLSSVLNSERAIQMNIMIFRAFVRVRVMIAASKDLADRVGKLETGHRQTASILNALVDEIEGIVDEVKTIKALPPASKRKIGFAR